jgi:signal transduction histidine kinase
MWRPGNLLGPLIYAWVLLANIYELPLIFPESEHAPVVAGLFPRVHLGVFVCMLFVFPTGRLWTRWAIPLIVFFTVIGPVMNLPLMLFDTWFYWTYLYRDHPWSGLDDWLRWNSGLVIAATLIVDALLIARIVKASPGARRRIAPLYLVWLTLWNVDIFIPALQALAPPLPFVPLPTWWVWYENSYGLWSAAAALFGLGLVRRKRSSVADLVVELGAVGPGQVRESLARTLGDPHLTLGLWLPDRNVWVDEHGREVAVPRDGKRGVTYVGHDLAVLIHDRDLLDQPKLLESAGAAARLALENERLQAELRAQLTELRESRARIVRTADEERRRLERDLHDGAQQRLLGLGMALQLLRSHVAAGGQPLLDETEAELQSAVDELRELARGIHPAVLTDQGLDAAVRTLAARAPIPVTVTTETTALPEHVTTAAYFVVAEALANVAKYSHASHASVDVTQTNGNLRVEIHDDGDGGARPGAGSGLRGLADRVGALDGRLAIDSPAGRGTTITAEIPCAS